MMDGEKEESVKAVLALMKQLHITAHDLQKQVECERGGGGSSVKSREFAAGEGKGNKSKDKGKDNNDEGEDKHHASTKPYATKYCGEDKDDGSEDKQRSSSIGKTTKIGKGELTMAEVRYSAGRFTKGNDLFSPWYFGQRAVKELMNEISKACHAQEQERSFIGLIQATMMGMWYCCLL
jgi:hypothetical protein